MSRDTAPAGGAGELPGAGASPDYLYKPEVVVPPFVVALPFNEWEVVTSLARRCSATPDIVAGLLIYMELERLKLIQPNPNPDSMRAGQGRLKAALTREVGEA